MRAGATMARAQRGDEVAGAALATVDETDTLIEGRLLIAASPPGCVRDDPPGSAHRRGGFPASLPRRAP